MEIDKGNNEQMNIRLLDFEILTYKKYERYQWKGSQFLNSILTTYLLAAKIKMSCFHKFIWRCKHSTKVQQALTEVYEMLKIFSSVSIKCQDLQK